MLQQEIDNLILEARGIDNKEAKERSDYLRAADIVFALDKFIASLPMEQQELAAKEISRKLNQPGPVSRNWRDQAWAKNKIA